MFTHDEKTILLVEDEPLIALNQKTVLQRNGLHVRVAASGEKAIRTVREAPEIDLVLMDIDLGSGIDGTVAAEQILELRELPIVFLTGHAEREMVEKVRRITRFGYVLKNAGEFVLIEAIVMAFELFDTNQQLRRREQWYRAALEGTPMEHDSPDAETHLRDVNQAYLENILRSAPTGIGIVSNRVIRRVNDRVCAMVGYTRDELVGNSIRMLYETDAEFEAVGARKYKAIHDSGVGTVETRWRRKDGTVIDVHVSSAPLYPGNDHTEYTFTALDISERQRARDQLTRALEEKTHLLAELNHRVKNNLMMVEALIGLKADQLTDPRQLDDLRVKVETIRTVHEKLGTGADTLQVDLPAYLPDLLRAVLAAAPTPAPPEIETEIAPAVVSARTAVSLGLIINELVTNAVKHAFPAVRHPTVAIHGVRDDGKYTLVLSHNGTAMPESIDFADPATLGLGLQLLTTLVDELNGTISHHRENELTAFSITVPL
ncbi:MAG: PAS domain S-box protein [Spirochaeta sp.]|nr:PAS domain S-box protein [Spirochaeta sp.]